MNTVLNVPVDLIDTAPQVRKTFRADALEELAMDIKAHGVLQPIVVQQNGERFTLIIGERRLRAIKYLGHLTAPAIIATIAESLRDEIQLTENIQREDLNSKDLCAAIHTLWKKHKSVTIVAKRCCKSSSWVSKRLSLAMKIGPLSARLLDANVEDLELIYLFNKLEKADKVKAGLLLIPIMEGKAGRPEIRDALTGDDVYMKAEQDEEADTTGDLFENEQAITKRSDSDAETIARLHTALTAIAGMPAGSPAAKKMQELAKAALTPLKPING